MHHWKSRYENDHSNELLKFYDQHTVLKYFHFPNKTRKDNKQSTIARSLHMFLRCTHNWCFIVDSAFFVYKFFLLWKFFFIRWYFFGFHFCELQYAQYNNLSLSISFSHFFTYAPGTVHTHTHTHTHGRTRTLNFIEINEKRIFLAHLTSIFIEWLFRWILLPILNPKINGIFYTIEMRTTEGLKRLLNETRSSFNIKI